MPQALTRDHRAKIGCLQNFFPVNGMNGALICAEETRSHLHPLGAEHECRRDASAVRNSARSNDRQARGVANLGNEHHGGEFAHMSAALSALCDQGRCAEPRHQLCHADGGDHRNHPDTRCDPFLDVFGRIARPGRDHLHPFFRDDLCDLVGKGTQQHDVHADGLGGDLPGSADLLPDVIARRVSRGDDAKTAAVGNGSGQLSVSDPSHTTLKYGVFDPQHFTNC